MNHVALIGRLTREVELKYTTSGAAVASGSLAVQRQFTNANGERESDFINFANMTAKGSLVGIEGALQTRNYENQQGQRVYVTEVIVNNFTLVETREQTDQRRTQFPQENTGGFNPEPQRQAPQQGGFSPNDMYGGGNAANINDDDLPF